MKRVFIDLIIFWVDLFISLMVGMSVMLLFYDSHNNNSPQQIAIITIISLVVFSLLRRKEIKSRISEIKQTKISLKSWLSILGSILIASGLMIAISSFIPNDNSRITKDLITNYPIFSFIFVVVLAPLYEEVVFRGVLQKKTNIWISSIIFGLFHLGNFSQPAISIIAPSLLLSLFGFYLGYLFEKYNSLLPSLLAHSGYNLIIYMLLV